MDEDIKGPGLNSASTSKQGSDKLPVNRDLILDNYHADRHIPTTNVPCSAVVLKSSSAHDSVCFAATRNERDKCIVKLSIQSQNLAFPLYLQTDMRNSPSQVATKYYALSTYQNHKEKTASARALIRMCWGGGSQLQAHAAWKSLGDPLTFPFALHASKGDGAPVN